MMGTRFGTVAVADLNFYQKLLEFGPDDERARRSCGMNRLVPNYLIVPVQRDGAWIGVVAGMKSGPD